MRVATVIAVLCIAVVAVSESAVVVRSAQLDATVNRDGSVHLSYEIHVEIPEGTGPLTEFPLSLPSSAFQLDQVRAYRCDSEVSANPEQDTRLQAERERSTGVPLAVKRHPDPEMTTEILLDLQEHPVPPGGVAELCVDAVIPNFVFLDMICRNSAYVSVRPTLLYSGGHEPSDLFVNIHLPEGIDPETVMGQQEWPREQIIYSLPVETATGHAVVRWTAHKPLSEIYWIAAIFPATNIKTQKARDGLQTEIRLTPREDLDLEATVQDDGKVRLVYQLAIENRNSCKPVDSVQFVLPGRPESISASVNDRVIYPKPYPNIYDSLIPYIGHDWYRAYNVTLGAQQIAPGRSGTIQLRTTLVREIHLQDPKQETVSMVLNPTASASGSWTAGSRWTTRIRLPHGIPESEVQPLTTKFTRIETVDGQVVVSWEQKKEPAPVDVSFPMGNIRNIQWEPADPAQWLTVARHFNNFSGFFEDFGPVLAPIGVVMLLVAFRVMTRKRRR